jgi:hypothetical protein
MKQITIMVEDKVGVLADISYILGKAKINIDAITVTKVGENAIIYIGVKDEKRAKDVLMNNSYRVMSSENLIIKMSDQPGELTRLSKLLADSGINIENIHMLTRDKESAVFSIKVDKTSKAEKLLAPYLNLE